MLTALLTVADSNPVTLTVFLILLLILVGLIVANLKVVPQSQSYVVERLGTYHDTWTAGIHVKIPFIDRIAKQISLKEQVVDFPPQPVITKDNVTMQIDTVVFYQITDSKLYAYGVEFPLSAIENLSATTLRNIIGEIELDQTLTSRDTINSQIRSILDVATDPWGIKVNRVELKNILPPREIQDAMEKQMKAERERRESILRAEGDKASRILVAEGQKESQILQAEGEKASAILRAEAVRETKIREAEGEAQAILRVQEATAQAIGYINDAHPGEAYLTLQRLQALANVANGQATKLIIPSDLQGVAGLVASAKEML
ncbi:MAG: SPFH/Band 7/PHB domain protein [Oscillospiraceae bacterium]|jgi:regulator of protease activity HflC (stomatin/prohibitin superfamily)|nr:SPFH/Band 7/PHB domain protein [Oscillospiraceae bacterium]